MSKLGHSMQPMYPALTPLKGPHPGGQQLAGLAFALPLGQIVSSDANCCPEHKHIANLCVDLLLASTAVLLAGALKFGTEIQQTDACCNS